MVPRRTYIVSVHEPDNHVVLEEVRTRRRARLTALTEIGAQIRRWLDEGPAREPGQPPIGERPW